VLDLVPEKNSAEKARLIKWDHKQLLQLLNPHFRVSFLRALFYQATKLYAT